MRDDAEFWNSEEMRSVQGLVRRDEQAALAVRRIQATEIALGDEAAKLPAKWFSPVKVSPLISYHGVFDSSIEGTRNWEAAPIPGVEISLGMGLMGGMLGAFTPMFSAYEAVEKGGHAALLLGFTLENFPNAMVVLGAAGAVSLGALSAAAWLPWRLLMKKRMKLVRRVESQALRQWLLARYGVQVDSSALSDLTERVLQSAGSFEESTETFTTTAGEELEFSNEGEGSSWSVRSPKREIEPVGEGVSDPAALGLEGETAVLYGAIAQRLQQLAAQDLTAEQAHVLARAREDLSNIVSIARRMQSLEPLTPQQDSKLAAVLGSLMEEVRALQGQLQASIDRDLEVQAEYIRSRKRVAGGGRLALAPVAAAVQDVQREEGAQTTVRGSIDALSDQEVGAASASMVNEGGKR